MGRLFAALYDCVTRRSEEAGVRAWRQDLLREARGTVLELGSGTGVNLPLFPAGIERLLLSEPDPHMRRRLEQRVDRCAVANVQVLDCPAERLPFEDASIDTVVAMLVLCTVPDPARALTEMSRVLRPGGALLFIEHVAATDPRTLRWQRRIEPFWEWLACGCHLTRPTRSLIEAAGLRSKDVVEAPMPNAPFWVRPTIRGAATRP